MYWKQDPKKHVYVAAHRGACADYPENTMLAFEKALEAGVDQIETDVHMTADGELVLIHDHRLERTTNGTGFVREHTLAEIKALDAGSHKGAQFAGIQVPTLRELMELVKDHPAMTLDIELKDYPDEGLEEFAHASCDKALAMIDEYGFTDRVVINSWSYSLNEYVYKKYGSKYRQHVYFPPNCMIGQAAIDPYSYGYCACMFGENGVPIASAEDCAAIRAKGVRTWAGAFVKDEETVDMALAVESELITCNNPKTVVDILRAKNLHP